MKLWIRLIGQRMPELPKVQCLF